MRESLFVGAWLAIVGVGLVQFQMYKATAGSSGNAASQWPEHNLLRRNDLGNTLLMFAHPRCPCSRASLNELAIVLDESAGGLAATVVFFRPVNADVGWTDADLVRRAAEIKGVRIVWDDGGQLAKLYGVETSGHVLVFRPSGELLFSGGVTAMRGHEGDNAGRDALASCLRTNLASGDASLVYGCPLVVDRRKNSPSNQLRSESP